MFETYKEAELQLPKFFLDEDNQTWDYIFRRIHTCWFHVVAKPSSDELEGTPKVFFFSGVDNLLALQLDHSVEISEISIVIPGWMNGSKTWTMELLKNISAGFEPELNNQQRALVYELNDGRRIVDSALKTSEKNIIDLTVIFEIEI